MNSDEIIDIFEDEVDTFDDEYLICPFCGYKRFVDFETFYSDNLDCEEEHTCPECGQKYIASRTVSFMYETFKPKKK